MRLSLPIALAALAATAQAQDECAMAMPVTVGSFTFDTALATLSPEVWPCAGNGGPDLWYSYTAATTGASSISTCGSSYDTALELFTGTCAALVPVDCNDDACGLQSTINFAATAGVTYTFRIGGWNGSTGFGTCTIDDGTPILNPMNGHYYRVVNGNMTWPDARMMAEAMTWQGSPGHLVTIQDQAELDWILLNVVPQRPWIGLFQNTMSPSYSEPGGGWEWVTGEPFNFANWAPGEPNNTSATAGPEDYAEMFGNGAWNDAEEAHANTSQFLVEWDFGSLGTNYCTAVANSTGITGTIAASGSLVVANNDLTLTASDLPNASFGFFLTSQTQGTVMNPGGSQGNLCLGGAIGRFVGAGQIQNTGPTGEYSLLLDLTQIPTPTGLVAVLPGQTWNFQGWHRDAVGGSATSNFTDGLETTFQ